MQSVFYDVDATSAKKRRSVKRNLENVALVVAKTTCGIRQSNYLPLLLYRIPLIRLLQIISILSKVFLFSSARPHDFNGMLGNGLPVSLYTTICGVLTFLNLKNS
jgi:hypothetical protein